ncbi:phosphoglycerate mutase-like protein 4 [Ricinus communis]|uniref:phosphoglycerate mutase-like protein 4 n=1 Tax=Ricinus communis TaxID=3988 RepID=UPI00201A2613|nr:phosphoglycerate mutase-like protein 4 [Ricinus communis]
MALFSGIVAMDYTEGHMDVELNDVGRQQAMAGSQRQLNSGMQDLDFLRALSRALTALSYEAFNALDLAQGPFFKECRVAGRLAEESEISAVYSSDLKRARQTAQIIASRCNVPEASLSSRTDQEIPVCDFFLLNLQTECMVTGQRVIVVTHGGVVRAFHKYAAPAEELPGKIKNTSINIFPMAGEDKWTIKTWGDIRHLSNIGFLETAFGGNTNSG